MNENISNTNNGDEVSLKEIILKIQEYKNEILENWKLLMIFIFPIVILMLYNAITTPPLYSCNLTFMLNDDEGGSSGLGGIAATFGLGIGGQGATNMEKILALSKSRNILERVLFENTEVNGKTDFFANHIIKIYKYHEEWDEESGIKDFLFTHGNVASFSRNENKALKILHSKLVGNKEAGVVGLFTSSLDEITGIMAFNPSTESEDLSINLAQSIYKQLKEFYVSKTIEKQQVTYNITKLKADSLLRELNAVQFRYLKSFDSRRGLTLRQFDNEQLQLKRKLEITTLVYGEATKNKELADFALRSRTPFIQVIDEPIYPIRPIKSSKVKAVAIAILLGSILGISFLLGRKIFRDTMK